MKKLLVSILLLTMATMSQASPREQKLFSKLDLNQTQKQDLKALHQQHKEDLRLFKQDLENNRQAVQAIIRQPDWDEQSARTIISTGQNLRASLHLKKAQHRHTVWNQLSASQQNKFASLTDKKRQRKGNKRKNKMFKGIGLTDEQKSELASIRESFKTKKSQLKETRKANQAVEKSIIQSVEFDIEKWQAHALSIEANRLELAIQQAKMRHDIWHVLTGEQQTKVAERQSKKRQRRAT